MSHPQSNNPAPYEARPTPLHQTGNSYISHQPVQSSGIEAAPPSYPSSAGQVNEKHEYTQPQPQHQQTIQPDAPQQTFQQGAQGKTNYQIATPLASLQQGPSPVDCPVCGVREMTKTEYVSGGTTHLSAILCCCCLCLGCVPYLASWFKDCEHKCGHCGAMLAVWHRSGRTEVLAHGRA